MTPVTSTPNWSITIALTVIYPSCGKTATERWRATLDDRAPEMYKYVERVHRFGRSGIVHHLMIAPGLSNELTRCWLDSLVKQAREKSYENIHLDAKDTLACFEQNIQTNRMLNKRMQ